MRQGSLLGKIILSAGSGVLVFVSLWTAAAVWWLYSQALSGLARDADSQSREMATALAPLVWNLDGPSIQNYLDTKAENPEFVSLVVDDPSGGHGWSPRRLARGTAVDQAPQASREAEIRYAGQPLGVLHLTMTLAPRQRDVTNSIVTVVVSLLLLFLAVLGSIAVSWRGVTTRLKGMVETMAAFSRQESDRRMREAPDELGVLAAGFNTMADRIVATTRSMEHEIQMRTESLIEAEKLALIGSLVAGVAHEINTPVGNGITITSWLTTRTRELREAQAQGRLDEALGVYLDDVETSLGILQSGLDRTSNLVLAFKKIGADQVVDESRLLSMPQFLDEVVVSLSPTLKRFPRDVTTVCDPDLAFETHPGALFQIVTNLVLNAHAHAFAPDQAGHIRIGAAATDGGVVLEVEDDGQGMDHDLQAKIFQPFFTTKRTEGGTGLGLSIVQSLVQSLGGTIEVFSAPGRGARFTVFLPGS